MAEHLPELYAKLEELQSEIQKHQVLAAISANMPSFTEGYIWSIQTFARRQFHARLVNLDSEWSGTSESYDPMCMDMQDRPCDVYLQLGAGYGYIEVDEWCWVDRPLFFEDGCPTDLHDALMAILNSIGEDVAKRFGIGFGLFGRIDQQAIMRVSRTA